jgi:hypothetical protein
VILIERSPLPATSPDELRHLPNGSRLIIRAARQQGERNTGRVSKNKANWNIPETMRKYLYPHRESGSVEWRPPDHPPVWRTLEPW